MPSFDAGYYAFTALIPLLSADAEVDPAPWRWQSRRCSVVHSLRDLLASLRTVEVPEAEGEPPEAGAAARPIPFSASDRTHFARLVVVDELAWNGHEGRDTLLELLKGALGWTERQTADRLPCPYLLVLLDFDAPAGGSAAVEDYLLELWSSMEQEWTLILRHCRGFDASPECRRRSYVELMQRHEVDSTFTYTGYGWAARQARLWDPTTGRFRSAGPDATPLALQLLILWLTLVLMVLLGPALLALVNRTAAGLGWFLHQLRPPHGWPLPPPLARLLATLLHPQLPPALLRWLEPLHLHSPTGARPWLPLPQADRLSWLLLLAGLVLLLPLLWSRLYSEAFAPWPAEPGTDLRSVLKALYLQGRFLDLVERRQRDRAAAGSVSLRRQFREFLEDSQPRDRDAPSLRPGFIQAIRRSPQP